MKRLACFAFNTQPMLGLLAYGSLARRRKSRSVKLKPPLALYFELTEK
jgi:urease gamma subunit